MIRAIHSTHEAPGANVGDFCADPVSLIANAHDQFIESQEFKYFGVTLQQGLAAEPEQCLRGEIDFLFEP